MPGLLDLIGKVSPQQYFQFGAGVLSQPSNVGLGIQQGLLGASQAKEKLEERKRKEQLQAAIGDVSLPLELRNLLSSLPPDQAGGVLAQYMMQGQGERKIVKGADGYNYYADTQERVLPGVQAKPTGDGGKGTWSPRNFFNRDTEQTAFGQYHSGTGEKMVQTEQGLVPAGSEWVLSPQYTGDSPKLTSRNEDWDNTLITARNARKLIRGTTEKLRQKGTLTGVLGGATRLAEGMADQARQLGEITGDDFQAIDNVANYDFGSMATASASVKANLIDLAYAKAKMLDRNARLTDRDVQHALNSLTGGNENSRLQMIHLLTQFDEFILTNLQSQSLLDPDRYSIPEGYFNFAPSDGEDDDPLGIR